MAPGKQEGQNDKRLFISSNNIFISCGQLFEHFDCNKIYEKLKNKNDSRSIVKGFFYIQMKM